MITEFLTIKKTFRSVEKEMLSQEMVSKWNEKQDIEEKKKASNKTFGLQIKNINKHISNLSRSIKQGFQEEEVECRVEKDFTKGVKNYFDKESGELLHSEKLSAEELQMEIQ